MRYHDNIKYLNRKFAMSSIREYTNEVRRPSLSTFHRFTWLSYLSGESTSLVHVRISHGIHIVTDLATNMKRNLFLPLYIYRLKRCSLSETSTWEKVVPINWQTQLRVRSWRGTSTFQLRFFHFAEKLVGTKEWNDHANWQQTLTFVNCIASGGRDEITGSKIFALPG